MPKQPTYPVLMETSTGGKITVEQYRKANAPRYMQKRKLKPEKEAPPPIQVATAVEIGEMQLTPQLADLIDITIAEPTREISRVDALDFCNVSLRNVTPQVMNSLLEQNAVLTPRELPQQYVRALQRYPSMSEKIETVLKEAISPLTYSTADAQPTDPVCEEVVAELARGIQRKKPVTISFPYALYKSPNILLSGGSFSVDAAEIIFLKRLENAAKVARRAGVQLKFVLLNEAPYAGKSDGIKQEQIEQILATAGSFLSDPYLSIYTYTPKIQPQATDDRNLRQVRGFLRSFGQQQLRLAGINLADIRARDEQILSGTSVIDKFPPSIIRLAEIATDEFTAGKAWTLKEIRGKIPQPAIDGTVLRKDKSLSIDLGSSRRGESRFPSYGIATFDMNGKYLGVTPFGEIVSSPDKYQGLVTDNGNVFGVQLTY